VDVSSAGQDLNHRVDAIKTLLDAFKLERIVYLTVTVLSVAILFVAAIRIILQEDTDYPALVGVVTGSGGILYATGRLLRMWSDALRIISPPPGKGASDA
jgi:hypothetical protein